MFSGSPLHIYDQTPEVTRQIDEDSEWAESSPMPEPEGAAYGVFDNSMVSPAFRPRVLEK